MRPRLPAVLVTLAALPANVAAALSSPRAWQDPPAAVDRAGCWRCHAGGEQHATPRGPRLDDAVRWHAADAGAAFLRTHHGGDDAPALAAWLQSLGQASPVPVPAMPMPGAVARGERLARELACAACHEPAAFAALAMRVDHGRLASFLAAPGVRFPELSHVPLRAAEAADVAAWLLAAQRRDEPVASGFRWTSWQLQITDAGLPDLAGCAVAGRGVTDRVDTTVAPRATHYALRFDGGIDVPHAATWKFTVGSDDSSWLWVDDRLLVRNEGLAPYRQRSGTIELSAGPHAVTVLFTQAGGGASLDVSWQGPGVDEEPIVGDGAAGGAGTWVGPLLPPTPEAAAVVSGRTAARARRCDACHDFADAAFVALPAPRELPAVAALREAPCPMEPAGQASRAATGIAAVGPPAQLAAAMARDGCLSCHRRDGGGGLPATVREALTEVEDLGDEGRLPPDLTAVGRRLRPAWIEKVLRTGHAVRPYVRMRMPGFGDAKARQYAAWFAAVDGGAAGTPLAPAAAGAEATTGGLDPETVQLGRRLAGLGGRNCITCHACQGLPSLGPQGMDLAIQFERVQPEWFRDWLLQPATLRPGTRMPALWWQDDATARREVAAIWAWLSLAQAAPLPPGSKAPADSLQLVASERPRLHGAFLDGVSARCLAVGTPERTHFAYDLTQPALVWLWRGGFLDASGTWSGRAGKLLRPLGADHRVLRDVVVAAGANRRLLGQRLSPEGYPVLRVAVGGAEYEDSARARLAVTGSEVVRTLRCVRGVLELEFPAAAEGMQVLVGERAAARHRLGAGDTLEVVYRW